MLYVFMTRTLAKGGEGV